MFGGSKAGRQLGVGRENRTCKGPEERAPGVIQEEPTWLEPRERKEDVRTGRKGVRWGSCQLWSKQDFYVSVNILF